MEEATMVLRRLEEVQDAHPEWFRQSADLQDALDWARGTVQALAGHNIDE